MPRPSNSYTGFAVIEPFAVHAPVRMTNDERYVLKATPEGKSVSKS
jgi:hypothetical protein